VNNLEFSRHPRIAGEITSHNKKRGPELVRFEGSVERAYTRELYTLCQIGLQRKESRKNAEVGIFGIGTDWDKVRRIEEEVVDSCQELRRLGF
jgi:DnaJ family protein B protein 12